MATWRGRLPTALGVLVGTAGGERVVGERASVARRPERPARPDDDGDVGPGPAPGPGDATGRRGRAVEAAAVVAVVGLAASTMVVGALSLVGDTWVPLSDWASLVLRVDQVGSADTPLVGPYSFHGFAHPGPLLYWVAAPAYHLTGGDTRSLLWVGAAVNVGAVVALAALAWRRGRWPLLLAATVFAALLVRGLGPQLVVDLWNPYVALLPFLLAIALVADAALGHRRSLVWAVVPASFAAQAHLAFAPLIGVVALWCLAWTRVGDPPGDGRARPPWGPALRPAALVAVALWVGPLVDAAVGLRNPVRVARSLVHGGDQVGLLGGVELVGSQVRPDGRWWRADGPHHVLTAGGPDAIAVPALALLLAGCAVVARRRGLRDAFALATLALALLVAAVPAVSRLDDPTNAYLAEWAKVIGAFAWFAVAWTAWRALGSHRSAGARRSAAAATALAAALVIGSTWVDAATMPLPPGDEVGVAAALREAAGAELDRGRTYRVEVVGDGVVQYSGLILALVEEGLTIVTDDGAPGEKWGRSHRWDRGDPVDAVLTLTADSLDSRTEEADACAADPDARLVFATAPLTPAQVAWLDDLAWRTLADRDAVSDADRRRWLELRARGAQIRLYESPAPCADDETGGSDDPGG